jgi:hypothetical protein
MIDFKKFRLPASILGDEPVHNWCYYCEKIDLVRQRGNWQEAAGLADEAFSKGLTPNDLSEWMPVLEAYVTTGDLKKAKHATAILRSNENTHLFMCPQLDKGSIYPAPYKYDLIYQLLCRPA